MSPESYAPLKPASGQAQDLGRSGATAMLTSQWCKRRPSLTTDVTNPGPIFHAGVTYVSLVQQAPGKFIFLVYCALHWV